MEVRLYRLRRDLDLCIFCVNIIDSSCSMAVNVFQCEINCFLSHGPSVHFVLSEIKEL